MEIFKKDYFLRFFIFAGVMTILTFYINLYNLNNLDNLNNLLKIFMLGFDSAVLDFKSFLTDKHIIIAPIIFWATIGACAYFFYFYLVTIYYYAFHNAMVSIFYTKPQVIEKTHLGPIKRIAFHISIIILSIVFFLIFLYILGPIGLNLINITKSLLVNESSNMVFYSSILVEFFYWFFIGIVLGGATQFLKIEEEEIKISKEHGFEALG